MLMRDEDVAKGGQRHPGEGQLTGHAIAAIDHVGGVVGDDHLRRRGAGLARTRTAARAQQDQLRAALAAPRARGCRKRDGARQKRSPADERYAVCHESEAG
jgi:hypothetical protein